MNRKSVAIIIARGGSKRIPKKNIKNFHGKPIIYYSISKAINSEIFDDVLVSTDDQEIAKIAESYGAKVPFMRSAKNSDDTSTTADVILEVLNELKNSGKDYFSFCCIYPTAPLLDIDNLKKAKQLIHSSECDSVFPITKFSFPIQRSLKINDSGFLEMNWPEMKTVRSQDLQENYHDAGQFYYLSVSEFYTNKSLYTEKSIGIEISNIIAQDIDNLEDWKLAEIKYKLLENK